MIEGGHSEIKAEDFSVAMKISVIIVLLALAVFNTPAIGQVNSSLEVGAQHILAFSKLHGNPFVNQMHTHTVSLGRSLYFQYNTKSPFSVRAEPGFERKGSQLDVASTDMNGNPLGMTNVKIKLDYYTLPVLCRATFGSDKVNYFVNAGPFIGYLNRSSVYVSGGGMPDMDPMNDSGNYKELDAGVSVGAGITIPVKDVIIFSVEARDNYGLYNTSRLPVINNASVKTNSVCLLLAMGYRFGN